MQGRQIKKIRATLGDNGSDPNVRLPHLWLRRHVAADPDAVEDPRERVTDSTGMCLCSGDEGGQRREQNSPIRGAGGLRRGVGSRRLNRSARVRLERATGIELA